MDLKMIINQLLFLTFTPTIILLLAMFTNLTVENDDIRCIETERQALLSFKHGLVDANGMLLSWRNENAEDCCNWRGVKCSNLSSHIIELDLRGSDTQQLSGKLDPSLLNLSHLNYLDLSYNNFTDTPIPNYLGSLINLKYLNLSYNRYFSDFVPPRIGNLSSLHTLDLRLSARSFQSLEWLSHLSSLEHLDLSLISLENASDWVKVINKLPHLKTLALASCDLLPPILPSYPSINISTSLSRLDLAENYLTSSIFPWLSNFNTSLVYLNLEHNNFQLQGYIPNTFGNMTSLSYIYLGLNQLEGASPKSSWNFCNLQSLSLPANKFKGTFSDFLQILPRCAISSLQHLDLFYNKFSGPLPDFSIFPNLKLLDLSSNEFSGKIPINLGQLSNLETLCLGHNSLEGTIFVAHFLKLTKLQTLDLSHNSLSFHPPSNWVPPFKLDSIDLNSCMLGPKFPKWLQGQTVVHLDISNASISDVVPNWFWNLSLNSYYLDLSENKIRGGIPNLSLKFTSLGEISLRSNEFEGRIPLFLLQTSYRLDVSNNKFSLLAFFCGNNTIFSLQYLDISNNQFSKEIPNCWGNFPNLRFLSLASNGISGGIPNSLSNLRQLDSLHLNQNSFYGEFPSWLKNLKHLQVLNLGGNNLSGPIPIWNGNEFTRLVALSLRSNRFHGDLPSSLCGLRCIQFLDLSLNNITGAIPNCLHNFSALTSNSSYFDRYNTPVIFVSSTRLQLIDRRQDYLEMIRMTWKGRESTIMKATLRLLKSIDFSGNYLTGEIPNKIAELVELNSLNLSRNNLTGKIPERIGELNALDYLDLSRNELVGRIPSGLSQISGLSVLDLSYNKLSGKIPTGTQLQSFNASAYMGNFELCGSPLPRCLEEQMIPNSSNEKDEAYENAFATRGFYVSLTLGFIVGFWGICGTLMFHRSWRHAYFGFLSDLNDWFYVKMAISMNKVQKLFKD